MLANLERARHPASSPSRQRRPARCCSERPGPRRGLHTRRRPLRRASECRKSLHTPRSNRVKRPDHGGPLFYGQYTSSDTGLIYLRNRVYDPSTAQFLTVDPLEAISGEPYSYAGDSPTTYGDSLGLLWTPLAGGAAGADAACGATFEIPGIDLGTCGAAGIASGAAAIGAAVGVVTAIAGEEGGDEGEAELKAKEAERENCGNPATPPGSKFEWKGEGPVGSDEGSWWDPETRESLHPDLGHEEPIGPHYDYKGPAGKYRIYPDGRIEPTKP